MRSGCRSRCAPALFGILFLMPLALCMATPRPRARIDRETVARFLEALMQRAHVPGLAASVVTPTGIQRFVLGKASAAADAPLPLEAQFELGSNSKAFTGLAIRLLEARGRLRLADPVSAYLPWLTLTHAGQVVDLRIRDLLFHTAGLRFQTLAHVRRYAADDELEPTVRSLVGERTLYPPGERYSYATVGYDVLGLLIERVSGMRFDRFIERELLRPLGLQATRVAGGSSPSVKKVQGHKLAFGRARPFDAPSYPGHAPAAYIESTLGDMERWLGIVAGQIQVHPELREALTRALQPDLTVVPDRAHGSFYASGWFYYQDWGVRVAHPGSNPSFSSCLSVRPAEGQGIVVLANLNSNDVAEACRGIDELLHVGATGEVDDLYRTLDRGCSFIVVLGAFGGTILLLAVAWRVYLVCTGQRLVSRKQMLAPHRIVGYSAVLLLSGLGVMAVPSLLLAGLPWRVLQEWGPSSLPVSVLVAWGVVMLASVYRFLSADVKVAP